MAAVKPRRRCSPRVAADSIPTTCGAHSRLGRSAAALALLLAALLAVLGALAWFVMRAKAAPALDPARREESPLSTTEPSAALEGPAEESPVPSAATGTAANSARTPIAREERGASLHATSRDAASGAPIPEMRLEFVEVLSTNQTPRTSYARADADGVIARESFPVGRWRITASSTRHRALVLGVHETRSGKLLDLGRITLEPLPVHRGRVLDANGAPAAGLWVSLPAARAEEQPHDPVVTDRSGTFELVGDLPARIVVHVRPPGPPPGSIAQRFAVEEWPPDTQLELRLAPYTKVSVELYGFRADQAAIPLYVCPAEYEATELGDVHVLGGFQHDPLLAARELQGGAEVRRYEFQVAEGRYQIWGGTPASQVRTKIEVRPDGPNSFAITAH